MVKLANYLFRLSVQRKLKDRGFHAILGWTYPVLMARNITPLVFSFLAFTTNLAATVVAFQKQWLFISFFLLYIFFDSVDGSYARATHQESKVGDAIDHGLDALGSFLFYIKAYFFLNALAIILIAALSIVNYVLIYRSHLESEVALANFVRYGTLFHLFALGIVLDFLYLAIFCPLRLYWLWRNSPSHFTT